MYRWRQAWQGPAVNRHPRSQRSQSPPHRDAPGRQPHRAARRDAAPWPRRTCARPDAPAAPVPARDPVPGPVPKPCSKPCSRPRARCRFANASTFSANIVAISSNPPVSPRRRSSPARPGSAAARSLRTASPRAHSMKTRLRLSLPGPCSSTANLRRCRDMLLSEPCSSAICAATRLSFGRSVTRRACSSTRR